MNNKRSQFTVMDDAVNNKRGHNIVKDSYAHKPDGLLVFCPVKLLNFVSILPSFSPYQWQIKKLAGEDKNLKSTVIFTCHLFLRLFLHDRRQCLSPSLNPLLNRNQTLLIFSSEHIQGFLWSE